MKDEKNPNWKGDSVGYVALHEWVRSRKPKPLSCEICKINKPYDLANISQEYKRDVNDFEWLCRSCHMTKDKRLENLKSTAIINCIDCNKIYQGLKGKSWFCSKQCKFRNKYKRYNKLYWKNYSKENRERINRLAREGYHKRKRSFVE